MHPYFMITTADFCGLTITTFEAYDTHFYKLVRASINVDIPGLVDIVMVILYIVFCDIVFLGQIHFQNLKNLNLIDTSVSLHINDFIHCSSRLFNL